MLIKLSFISTDSFPTGTFMLTNCWLLVLLVCVGLTMSFSDLYILWLLVLSCCSCCCCCCCLPNIFDLFEVMLDLVDELKLGSWKVISSLKIWSLSRRYLAIDVSTSCLLAIDSLVCLLFLSLVWVWDWLIALAKLRMNWGSLSRQTTISISWSTLYCFRMRSMDERRIPMTFLPFIDTKISPVINWGLETKIKMKSH